MENPLANRYDGGFRKAKIVLKPRNRIICMLYPHPAPQNLPPACHTAVSNNRPVVGCLLNMSCKAPQKCESGFTLLEVLTAMALFFMVAGLLTSAVVQAIRVADVGAVETTNARDQSMRLQWFRETIGLTVLPAVDPKAINPAPPLVGDMRSVNGLSLRTQSSQSLGPTKYRFELRFDATSGETQLQLIELEPLFGDSEAGANLVLASWLGSSGRFRYLDNEDRWRDIWPERSSPGQATNFSRSQLPKAIELQYGASGGAIKSVVVAIQDRALPLPSMRELMQ